MIFIVDGHNLIPKVPGIYLSDMDDEIKLIKVLQQFCLDHRHQVRVFFDQAPPNMSGRRKHGNVTAYFVKQGITADQAIRTHLQNAGRQAENWAVVSSDHEVRQSGKWARAKLYDSATFSRMLQEPPPGKAGADIAADLQLKADEVEEWLDIFGHSAED